MSKSDGSTAEYTGGSVSYYTVTVQSPTMEGRDPYKAECNDIIEALKMTYAEGNAFKAIWRKCAARLGTMKAGYTDGLYDAEKVEFFGGRMVAIEKVARSLLASTYTDPHDTFGKPLPVEPASEIDDESPRAEILGQNGEMAEEVYSALDGEPSWDDAPEGAVMFIDWQDSCIEPAFYADGGDRFFAIRVGVLTDYYVPKTSLNGFHHPVYFRPHKDAQ